MAVGSSRCDDPARSAGGTPAAVPPRSAQRTDPTHSEAEWREAQVRANACQEFIRLTEIEHWSLVGAARYLGRSPAFFCGPDAMLARWLRGGVAALLPEQKSKASSLKSEVTAQIEALDWFIKAASFFYSASNVASGRGSVPEAIQRTISLPNLPNGWSRAITAKFLRFLNLNELPVCPVELRELILARAKNGQPFVPTRIHRQITVNRSVIELSRSPREWELNNLSAPGSQRRFKNDAGARVIMQPGDWFGGDDATPGIAVCVPCDEVITPCAQKFKVLLGRFQWLVYNDCRTDKILGWDYVVRPRGSYRFEDILNGMGSVTRTHGIPREGWQFEGGTFNAKLVREAIHLMGCQHWLTYSPHQKPIESVFNRVWTRLALQFPHADMGRYRNENEANCKLYEACKRGHQDPRRYFPTLAMVVAVFEEEVAAHNARQINSAQYGRWVPDEYFSQEVSAKPLRAFSPELAWIFSPYAAERKVRGMLVTCRVPMFEDFSVPFEFSAPWLNLYRGKSVRMHFDPRVPRCTAKLVLLENSGEQKAGTILGDAQLIGETSGHIRFIMEYAQDDQRAGYKARQQTAGFMRRVSRGVGLGGRTEYAADEQRDGLNQVVKVERSTRAATGEPQGDETARPHRAQNPALVNECSPPSDGLIPSTEASRRHRLREIEELEKSNAHLFT